MKYKFQKGDKVTTTWGDLGIIENCSQEPGGNVYMIREKSGKFVQHPEHTLHLAKETKRG